jgi:hypothetical protein
MTTNEQFFYDNGGYNYDPVKETREQGRIRCAIELAAAERWMQEQGLTRSVVPDDCPDLSWMSEEDRADVCEVVGVLLKDNEGKTISSLFGIVDPDDNYLRVATAELALEIMQEWQKMDSWF